jgi:ATP-dependent helicase/nuclease subunit A
MGLNEAQRDAARAHDRHLLVSAGAGTGKTRTVVARILYLLGVEVEGHRIADPVPLGRIAAITFTNAAAADLKRDLRKALREEGRRDEAYAVDTARIGTIHSFCGDVLREFALRRGRNPSPKVLTEGDAAALAAEATRETLLASLEADAIAGLPALVTDYGAEEVEGFVAALVGQTHRLRRIAERRDALRAPERALVDLALRTSAAIEERLHRMGAVDFDRIVVWTRDLVRDDPYVRRTLQRRIHTLIVDEFQDVDDEQREIAYALGQPETGRADTTRLLLVGDAKQSIYRFRRADVTVWRRVERDFRDGFGDVVSLSENYRSTTPILGFVDATVGKILGTPLEGADLRDFEVPFAALVPGTKEQRDGPPVELQIVPLAPTGKDCSAGDVRAIEAEALARRARELHASGIEWKQMAVLVPAWSGAEYYRAALARIGAPTYLRREEGFLERREVLDLIVALEAIRDPLDDRALLGFLRSPFVGLEDQTLYAIRRQAGDGPCWPALENVTVGEGERLQFGRDLLARHVAVRDRVATHELLESLLLESGYLAHLHLLGDDRKQAIANVRKLIGIARGAADRSAGELLRNLRELRDRGERLGDQRLYGEADDVVTITTVHGAKGLEWEVVFWADAVRTPDGRKGNLCITRDTLALLAPDEDAKDPASPFGALAARDALESEAERKRLWYVAATRARRHLVVTGLPLGRRAKPDRTMASALFARLGAFDVEDGAMFEYASADGARHTGVVRIARPEWIEEQGPVGAEAAALPDVSSLTLPLAPVSVTAGNPRHSATEMLAFARCPTRHRFKYVLGLREPEVDRSGADFISAVARGSIVHDVLQRYREEDECDALLEDAIGRWDEHAPPPETPEGGRYREHLKEEIARVATHPDYRAVADLPGARRELPFLHVAGAGHFYQGAIDLAAPGERGYVLLDVKTAQCDAEQAKKKAAHYAPQRDVYVRAAEAIGGQPVERFGFQFSRAGVQASEDVTDERRVEIEASLADRLERMGVAEPALTEHPWECRWCGYEGVGWCAGVKCEE